MNTEAEAIQSLPIVSVVYEFPELVELQKLASALGGISREYKTFAKERREEGIDVPGGGRLALREVRGGSFVFDLLPLMLEFQRDVPHLVPLLQDERVWNVLRDFVEHMNGLKGWLMDMLALPRRLRYIESHLNNVENAVDPLAGQTGAALSISIQAGGDIVDSFRIDTSEALETMRGVERERRRLAEQHYTRDRVRLQWYQAKNDPESTSGNRAIIESIHPKPIKTVFAGETPRINMLSQAGQNPFRRVYTVDVTVQGVVGRKPKKYIVDAVHESELAE